MSTTAHELAQTMLDGINTISRCRGALLLLALLLILAFAVGFLIGKPTVLKDDRPKAMDGFNP